MFVLATRDLLRLPLEFALACEPQYLFTCLAKFGLAQGRPAHTTNTKINREISRFEEQHTNDADILPPTHVSQ